MSIRELVSVICQKKENVLKLNSKSLKKYKSEFYSQPFKIWQLDLLWEFVWNDISLNDLKRIFRIGD